MKGKNTRFALGAGERRGILYIEEAAKSPPIVA
jgi:hypothetical protein